MGSLILMVYTLVAVTVPPPAVVPVSGDGEFWVPTSTGGSTDITGCRIDE